MAVPLSKLLTVRDHFAGLAMQYVGAFGRAARTPHDEQSVSDARLLELARGCYRVADAMLKAREHKP